MTKEHLKTGAIVFVSALLALAVHQTVIAPKLVKKA